MSIILEWGNQFAHIRAYNARIVIECLEDDEEGTKRASFLTHRLLLPISLIEKPTPSTSSLLGVTKLDMSGEHGHQKCTKG